ncbi:MAG: Internalin-A precursor [Firmicutes bacterium ADurb.Bin373]|nr:MAG: Internalin-A precursor [Firmicutes bacterium ADurb.Bin373]
MIKRVRGSIVIILSLCLFQAAMMLFLCENACAQTVFSDIGENDPLLPYTRFLHEKGIVSGFPDGTFRPADSLTRAQAAGMVVLAKGLQPIAGGQPSFSDVSPGHWAYGTVEAAVGDGLLQGYPDGSFGPENTITRAEAVTLLLNLSGGALSGQDVAVSDVAAGHWAYRQVATAVAAGLVELPAGNLFYPGQPLRRDELARGLTNVITLGPSLRANELTGKLRIIKGKVALTTPEEGLVSEISGETKVSAGAKISTFENSQAEITFDDGSGILIEANSEIIIKKSRGNAYMRNDGSPGVAVDRLELELTKGKMSGALASRYDLPGVRAAESGYVLLAGYGERQDVPWWEEPYTERERVVVDMPWGVAGIRGTYWMIDISSGSQSVSLIIGNAVVTAGGKTISITGDQCVVMQSAGGQPSSPAPLNAEQKEAWLALKDWVEARALDVGLNMPADIEPAISMTITQVEELPELPGIPVQEVPPEETAAFTAVMEAFAQATGETGTTTPPATTPTTDSDGGGDSGIDVVHFSDADLEAAVRNALNKPAGDITSADMAGLTQFDASDQDIADLRGLEYAVNLRELYLDDNLVSDLDVLKGLVNLQYLALEGNQISDISALAGLTSLQILWLANNQVSDLDPLSGLINLQSLFLRDNSVSALDALGELTGLLALDLGSNQVGDLKGLAGLTGLKTIDLSNNQISDLEGLTGLTGLMTLNLSDNQVSALDELSGLINLQGLFLGNNQICNLDPLAGLLALQFLHLYDNQVSDLHALEDMTKLQILVLDNNQVSDLDPLAELINLQILYINNNLVSDLDALKGLVNLRVLILHNNQISNIGALADLINLEHIDLANNQITDLAPLAVNCQGGGLGQHDYVDISYNLLDLNPDSQAMNDIDILLNNNVNIVYEPQN